MEIVDLLKEERIEQAEHRAVIRYMVKVVDADDNGFGAVLTQHLHYARGFPGIAWKADYSQFICSAAVQGIHGIAELVPEYFRIAVGQTYPGVRRVRFLQPFAYGCGFPKSCAGDNKGKWIRDRMVDKAVHTRTFVYGPGPHNRGLSDSPPNDVAIVPGSERTRGSRRITLRAIEA